MADVTEGGTVGGMARVRPSTGARTGLAKPRRVSSGRADRSGLWQPLTAGDTAHPLDPRPWPEGVDATRLPRHVACVMDGNGRWAARRGLPRTEGHSAGEESLFDVVEGALDLGIPWLSVYAFSTENWRRPADEVRYLMHIMSDTILGRRREELHERGVRVTFAGRRDWRVPKRVLRHMDEVSELTRDNDRLTFVIAFNYGGRAEIVDAVKALVAEGTPAERIDERAISAHLYQPGMPEPDLVVRTSGEYRVSNFWLWELAYSELVFTETLWPDFRREDLFAAVREFQGRDRRFGAVGDHGEARG
ncbi:MAG: isoprenyl transferase [Acidimicrobiales bacterium]